MVKVWMKPTFIASARLPAPIGGREYAAPAGGLAAFDLTVDSPRPMFLLLLNLLLVLAYSRLVEILPGRGLILGLGLILLGYIALSNRWMYSLWTLPTLLLVVMTAWMIVSAVIGIWPGGSVRLIVNNWSRSLLIYVLVICMIPDPNSLRRVMAGIAFACVVILLMGFWLGVEEQARLSIETSTLGNPNDLAAVLLIGLPFCVWFALDPQRGRVVRILMGLVCVTDLIVVLKTGSRMGVIVLIAVGLVLFLVVSLRLRVLLVLGSIAFIVLAVFILPEGLERRYLTMLTSEVKEGDWQVEYAVGSWRSRVELFVTSLRITVQKPLFGVGPGNFSDANAVVTRQAFGRGIWLQTHNSFTQVSSECGIPAALCFLGLVLYSLRHAHRTRKLARTVPAVNAYARMALCLFMAVLAYTVCACFASSAYSIHLPLLCAMVCSLDRCFNRLLARAATPQAGT